MQPGPRRNSWEGNPMWRPPMAPSAQNEHYIHRCERGHKNRAPDYYHEYTNYRQLFMNREELQEWQNVYGSAYEQTRIEQKRALKGQGYDDYDDESDKDSKEGDLAWHLAGGNEQEKIRQQQQQTMYKKYDHVPDSELAFLAAANCLERIDGREINTPYVPNDPLHWGSGANIHKRPELWNDNKTTKNYDLTLMDDRFGTGTPVLFYQLSHSAGIGRPGKDSPPNFREDRPQIHNRRAAKAHRIAKEQRERLRDMNCGTCMYH